MTVERVRDIILKDERTPWLNIHSAYDEMPLTLEAFRVLAHLSRRADNQDSIATPSYASIGEACFRSSYPKSSKDTLRRKAIKAVNELVGYGLIRKETLYKKETDEALGNTYVLSHCSEWNIDYTGAESTRNCKGNREKPGGSAGQTLGSAGRTLGGGSAGQTLGSAGQTLGSAGRTPKGNPGEGNPGEGNPLNTNTPLTPQRGNGGIDAIEQKGVQISKVTDPQSIHADSVQPGSESTSLNKAPNSEAVKRSGAKKSQRNKKRKKSAKEVYAETPQYEVFEGWYRWYVNTLCPLNDSKPGDRVAAAEQWKLMVESGVELDEFRRGCQAYLAQQRVKPCGIPNAYIFLKGKVGHPQPYWLEALENAEISSNGDDSGQFLSGVAPLQSDAETLKSELGKLMRELGLNVVLLDEWKTVSGCQKSYTSELGSEELKSYVTHLKAKLNSTRERGAA